MQYSIPPRPCLWRNLCRFPQSVEVVHPWMQGRQQGCTEGPEGRIWLLPTVMSDRRGTPSSLRVHRELGTGEGCFIPGKSDTEQNRSPLAGYLMAQEKDVPGGRAHPALCDTKQAGRGGHGWKKKTCTFSWPFPLPVLEDVCTEKHLFIPA